MRIEEASPMNCSYPRVELFGTAVDAVTMDQAVDAARAAVAAGGPHQHVVLNAAKVVAMQDDPELARIIRGCDFIQADGASVVWFSKLARRPVLLDALIEPRFGVPLGQDAPASRLADLTRLPLWRVRASLRELRGQDLLEFAMPIGDENDRPHRLTPTGAEVLDLSRALDGDTTE